MNLGKISFITRLGSQYAIQHTTFKYEQSEKNIQALSKALNTKDKAQCNKKASKTTWSIKRKYQKKKTLKFLGMSIT